MLYEYKCQDCKEIEDVKLGMNDPKDPRVCSFCGGVSKRLFSPAQDIWKDGAGNIVRSPGKAWVGGEKFDPVKFKKQNPNWRKK